MILVVRHFHDPVADALVGRLGHGARQIMIESWFRDFKIRHGVGVGGAVAEMSAWLTGQLFTSQISAVFNRVRSVQRLASGATNAEDANYFSAEASALYWSCLEAMRCPVINSMTAIGMLGSGLRGPQMLSLAAACGVAPANHIFSTKPPPRNYSRQTERARLYCAAMGAQIAPYMRTDALETKEIWWVASHIVGDCEGLPVNGLALFTQRAGLGFARLVFDRFDDRNWQLSLIDPFPLSAPEHVVESLACALNEIPSVSAIEGRAA